MGEPPGLGLRPPAEVSPVAEARKSDMRTPAYSFTELRTPHLASGSPRPTMIPRLRPSRGPTLALQRSINRARLRPQRRQQSSAPATQPQQPPTPQPTPFLRRALGPAVLLAAGFTLGTTIKLYLAPPAPPEPGTAEDAAAARAIAAAAERLPIVRELRGNPEWESWDAYVGFATPADTTEDGELGISGAATAAAAAAKPRPDRLTTGPMAGSRGLGAFQRVHRHVPTNQFVTVIHFGGALSGWPGVVHGGALATVLDESLGRVAVRALAGGTGVTARLEVRYAAPTLANQFYLVRAAVVPEVELEESERGKGGRKVWCRARLEDMSGKVCVEARGLFVTPKGITLRKLGDRF
jgi:acyl-coenzyme A thioesterase PaaI-like protein